MAEPDDVEQRIWLAAQLTPKEAAWLRMEASGVVRDPCCPHLDIFHNKGKTSDGGDWRACTIFGCGCTEKTLPDEYVRSRAAFEARDAKRSLYEAIISWCMVALIVGLVAGFLLGMHVVERVRPSSAAVDHTDQGKHLSIQATTVRK